ncbi:MAG: DeoR/GlpR transcriptional regulator [Clostridiales bacterium]|nr:DeoR/GlpR transcriptional regulator [Clostridiales bacterium]
MLSEERFILILDILQEKQSITVGELVEQLGISESTVRRDLTSLSRMGKLNKVHGGATSLEKSYFNEEFDVKTKHTLNVLDKKKIGKFAASIIEEGDFVYIDAGTSTEYMIDYIEEKKATYVTNGIVHAKKLIQKGLEVFILGGQIKLSTEAIIGIEAVNNIKKYNFTKCFMGTNGIDIKAELTTPDVKEALLKSEAMNRSKKRYVLADISKFNKISSITFGNMDKTIIITTKVIQKEFMKNKNIVEVDQL